MSALQVIDQHIPSLTDEDEERILYEAAKGYDDSAADLAIRTCACGKHIDGFYEYVDHLKEEIRKCAA